MLKIEFSMNSEYDQLRNAIISQTVLYLDIVDFQFTENHKGYFVIKKKDESEDNAKWVQIGMLEDLDGNIFSARMPFEQEKGYYEFKIVIYENINNENVIVKESSYSCFYYYDIEYEQETINNTKEYSLLSKMFRELNDISDNLDSAIYNYIINKDINNDVYKYVDDRANIKANEMLDMLSNAFKDLYRKE